MNNQKSDMSSKLNIVVGPMFSGKTTEIIKQYKKNKLNNIPTMVINCIEDNRYSNTKLSSHDNVLIPCIKMKYLKEIYGYLKDFMEIETSFQHKYILINEGQFFTDLHKIVKELLSINNIIVIVSGLDGDYKMEKFGQILDLVPMANKIIKLSAKCYNCANPAHFTMRKIDSSQQKLIGTADIYSASCRECHK